MQKTVKVITKDSDNYSKKIDRIIFKLKVKDTKCHFNITDIIVQTGDKSSIWNCHPSEVRWDFN